MSTAVSSSPEVSSPEGFSPEGFSTELPASDAIATSAGADAPFTSPADKLRGRELDRQILGLALPALGGLVASPIFVMIDSSMVGHLGADPLAALSLASSILTTAVGLFVFLTYATTATTARHFGAGRRREGLKAGLDGIWLAALIGVAVAGVAMVFAPQIVAAMGAKASVATNAVAYLRMVLPGLPGMLVVLAATGTLRGLLDTRTPFIVALAGAVLNTLLNAFFLYVVGLGVAGSGLGTALAELSMGAALVAMIVWTIVTILIGGDVLAESFLWVIAPLAWPETAIPVQRFIIAMPLAALGCVVSWYVVRVAGRRHVENA